MYFIVFLVASPPKNLIVICRYDNISSFSFMSITWKPPEKPNGIIQRYNIQLNGVARFKNDMGRLDIHNFEPPSWSVYNRNSTHYNKIPPNTNYTVYNLFKFKSSFYLLILLKYTLGYFSFN